MMSPRIILGIWLFLLLAPGFTPAIRAQEKEERPTVEDVSFTGNTAFESDSLLPLMVMRPAGFLRSTEFQPDVFQGDMKNIVAFYQNHGYLDAAIIDTHITRNDVENTVALTIGIREGEQTFVEQIGTRGNMLFPDTLLLRMIGLHPGEPFFRQQIQTGMVNIVAMYADSGYLDATIEPEVTINPSLRRATIILTVNERRQRIVSDIRITGLEKTQPYVVMRELEFAEGEVVRYSKLLDSQRRLYQTGIFQSVFIRPASAGDSLSAATIVRIEAQEKLSGEFNVAIGYGSVERVMGRVEVINTNLLGTGRRASLMTEANFIRQGIEGSWTEPWTLGTRWQTTANPFFQYLYEPSYQLRRYGGILSLSRYYAHTARLSIAFRYQNAALIDVRTTEVLQDYKPSIRSLTLTFADDTRNDLFDPRSGYFLELTAEMAGSFLRGTNTFVRTIGRARYFYPADNSTVLGSSLQVGWMDFFGPSRSIPINERFFAGGPTSLRGFPYQEAGPVDVNQRPLGGQFMIVWNLIEARRSIYTIFGGALFLDVGNVWPRLRDFRPGDIRVGAGAGLRVNTPVGIVRVDYGINVYHRVREPKSLFYFSMGQAF